ncbi:MAG: LuxR C-terminal-related transcriptional regulator [Bacteroidales bacterium]|jgi:DNA-binding CsgD family transcriptional regulator|nr:LuxR C-terminal-related transcriptional regulator [Bacteroidales bacterium]
MDPESNNLKKAVVEPWEKLFAEKFGNSLRLPFNGKIEVNDQVLELFDYANQFFFLADYSTLRMLYVSPNVEQVLGYREPGYDFPKHFEIIHPDDRKPVFEIGKMVLNREMNYISGLSNRHVVLYMTYRAAKSNGRYTRISLTISRHINQEGGIYEMAVIRDISHIHCGTKVSFSLLGGRPFREVPEVHGGGPSISRREQEIIYHISRGYTSRRIAYELNISEFTVNTHRKNIMRKTGTSNLVDMLIYAATNGII